MNRIAVWVWVFILEAAVLFFPSMADVPGMLNYQGRILVNGTNFTGMGQFKFALVDDGTDTSSPATATANVMEGVILSYTVTHGGSGYVTPPGVTITDVTGTGATATAQISSAGVVTNIARGAFGNGAYSATPTVFVDPPAPSLSYRTYWSNGADAVTVQVSRGLYSVLLGDNMAAIPPTVFTNTDVRLRVWFNDGVTGFQQLTPDQRIAAVGYAMVANTAQGVSAGGVTASMIANGAIGKAHLATGAVTSVAIANGAVGAASLGSNAVTTAALADGAVTAAKVRQTADPWLVATIGKPDYLVNDWLPFNFAGVGLDRVVAGDDGYYTGTGHVYVYDLCGTLLTTITAPDGSDLFGGGVAGVGLDRFVVESRSGLYVYDANGQLLATNATIGFDFLGAIARVGQERFVVGDASCSNRVGIARLYDLNGALLTTITNPTPVEDDDFGYSVAGIGTNRFIVTAPGDDTAGEGAGSAYIYNLNGQLLVTITNPFPASGSWFGQGFMAGGVAGVGSNRFVIGDGAANIGTQFAGCAYLYDLDGNLLATITNPTPRCGDLFGIHLAPVGQDRFIVGAELDEPGGSAYLYDVNGILLAAITDPMSGWRQFGYCVAGVGSDCFAVLDNTQTWYLYNPSGKHAEGLIADGVQARGVTKLMLATNIGVWTRSGSDIFYNDGGVGIGTQDPAERLDVVGAVKLGNTANPAPSAGTIRWSGTDFEGFNGGRWVSLTGGSPIDMSLIPAGSFQMGNCMDPGEGESFELPVHTVYVSAFYLDRYDVTKAKWDEVYNWAITHGYDFDNAGSGKAADHPVQTVNWYDCVKWCNARSEKEGRTPAYYTSATITTAYRTGQVDVQNDWVNWSGGGYRLPTEAEWEKAARGGVSGQRFPWGDMIDHTWANYRSAWSEGVHLVPYDSGYEGYDTRYVIGDSPYTSPVGSFPANGYGLYDMVGNVKQWCWDWWHGDWYSDISALQDDVRGPISSGYTPVRVMRGGIWYNGAKECRTADRLHYGWASSAQDRVGFRCARGL